MSLYFRLCGQYCKQCFDSNTNNFDPHAPADPKHLLIQIHSQLLQKVFAQQDLDVE